MKTKITASVLFLILASNVYCQLPVSDTLWTRMYDFGSLEDCYSVVQTRDHGFILVGETNLSETDEAFLLKTDSLGSLIWMNTCGGAANDVFESVVLMPDGGFALGGKTSSSGAGGPDMWLARTDSMGNVLWQHTYGGPDWDWCHDLIRTSDGGFALGGFTNNYGAGYYENMWLVKTDSLGNMQWQHSYGGPSVDQCRSLQQTSDGGFVLGGYFGIDYQYNCDMYLVKTDAQGILQWSRTFGGPGSEAAYQIYQLSDGGYALGGTTTSFGAGNYDMWLVRTDSSGNQLWQHTFGSNMEDICFCMAIVPDAGYILGGEWAGRFCTLKTDSLGNLEWQRNIYTSHGSCAYSLCQTNDGGFTFGGQNILYDPSRNENIYLVKFNGIRNAWVSLQPSNPHITIPATGGSFQFTVSLTNCGTISCRPDAWIAVRLPNGQTYGPVLGPFSIPLDTGQVISRLRTQTVSASAPAGVYTYKAYVGTYNTAKWDSSSFSFTKLGVGDCGLGVGDWFCAGEPFPGEGAVNKEIHSSSFILHPSSPNPFNSTTTISYQLPAFNHVKLRVFDTTGRLASTLVDGWTQAGTHCTTFNGSNLASGIYLYTLKAGEFTATKKMLLLK